MISKVYLSDYANISEDTVVISESAYDGLFEVIFIPDQEQAFQRNPSEPVKFRITHKAARELYEYLGRII